MRKPSRRKVVSSFAWGVRNERFMGTVSCEKGLKTGRCPAGHVLWRGEEIVVVVWTEEA